MPDLADAKIEFATIDPERIGGITFTLTRGITPSAALIRLPSESVEPMVGDLALTFGSTVMRFRECAIVDVPLRHQIGRETTVEAIVWDRRWKWRYGEISGEWNRRACNGRVVQSTKKSIRELVYKCFQALGEPTVNLSVLPDNIYPHVFWDRANPAQELMWLCELCGCIPGIDAYDETKVWRMGQGSFPTNNDRDLIGEYRSKPTVLPSAVRVASAPTIRQAKMKLEPVGKDIDGSIKHIDLLSYKPSGGWGKQWWNAFPDVDPEYRHLAAETVWRWYRIVGRENGGWNFDDLPIALPNGLNHILPIRECLAEAIDDDAGEPRCLYPVISGIFWPLCDHKINTPKRAIWTGQVHLNRERGIFEFEHPVIQWSGGDPAAAELYATVAFNIRDVNGDMDEVSQDFPVPDAQAATEPRIAKRPDMSPVVVYDSVVVGGSAHHNFGEILPEMISQGNRLVSTYAYPYAQTIVRGWIDRVSPDGVVAQVQWRMGNMQPVGTTLGINTEFDTFTKAYQTRRREERLSQIGGRLWI